MDFTRNFSGEMHWSRPSVIGSSPWMTSPWLTTNSCNSLTFNITTDCGGTGLAKITITTHTKYFNSVSIAKLVIIVNCVLVSKFYIWFTYKSVLSDSNIFKTYFIISTYKWIIVRRNTSTVLRRRPSDPVFFCSFFPWAATRSDPSQPSFGTASISTDWF